MSTTPTPEAIRSSADTATPQPPTVEQAQALAIELGGPSLLVYAYLTTASDVHKHTRNWRMIEPVLKTVTHKMADVKAEKMAAEVVYTTTKDMYGRIPAVDGKHPLQIMLEEAAEKADAFKSFVHGFVEPTIKRLEKAESAACSYDNQSEW